MQPLNMRVVLKKPPIRWKGAKLPNKAHQATEVFAIFAIAPVKRIGEKGAKIWPKLILRGEKHDLGYAARSDSWRHRGCHGVPACVLDRPSVAGGPLLRSRRR